MKKSLIAAIVAITLLCTGCSKKDNGTKDILGVGDINAAYSKLKADGTLSSLANANSSAQPIEESNSTDSTNFTVGQQNALKEAQKHISKNSYSREGLIQKLEFDTFTHEEAVYAVDNCGADWKEQAVRAAQNWLKIGGYSSEEIIQALEHDKFTHEEAVYAVDNCGADWKEQAYEYAILALKWDEYSRDELIDKIMSRGFTQEEAIFAVDAVSVQ